MLELIICSMLTILPDYLYRRYVQGKRIGKEITFFSVWFELRYGIVACLMLTVSLITLIFYFHPSTSTATLYFRTVPILPEATGVSPRSIIDYSAPVAKGAVHFQAGQLEAGGRTGDGPAEDRRSRRFADRCKSGRAENGRPDSGGEELPFSRLRMNCR